MIKTISLPRALLAVQRRVLQLATVLQVRLAERSEDF
jgi:hypothetical protein